MAPIAKQKLARRSTAAYIASQPLFDALRTATERVEEQKRNLIIARDLVQNLHVKVANTSPANDVDRHQRYTDCAVKAWQAATQVYADVFQALADVTAAQPHEGKEERYGHAEFTSMAKTASKAKVAADNFKLYEDLAKEGAAPAKAEVEDVSMQDIADDGQDQPAKPNGSPERRRKGGKAPEDLAADKEARRRAKRKHRRAGRNADKAVNGGDDVHQSVTEVTTQAVPLDVEYEDITGEVDRRLQEKAKEREEAKQAKKRKRASADSVASLVEPTEAARNDKKKVKLDTEVVQGKEGSKKRSNGEEAVVGSHAAKKKKIKA